MSRRGLDAAFNELLGCKERKVVTSVDQLAERCRISRTPAKRQLEAVAWAAWERSCQNAQTRHQRTEAVRLVPGKRKAVGPARLVPVKRMSEKTTKGQPGDPRFLAQVGWRVETRLKVMGILRDIKNVNQQIVTRLDWESLVRSLPPDAHEDRIPKELEALEHGLRPKQVQGTPAPRLPYGIKELANGNGDNHYE